MRTRRGLSALRYAVLIILALLFLLPFYLLLRNAFATQAEIASARWVWWPSEIGTDGLVRLLTDPDVGLPRALLNSAVVSVVQTGVTVIISAMAGYGMARIPSRLNTVAVIMTVLTLMVPAAVTFVPTFVMVSSLGWISTLRGLIVPLVFSAFATFVFRQAFLGFPQELEDAAAVDGAGPWRTFWRVVMPNMLGTCAAVGTITFIGAWNAFLWPLLIGQDRDFRTVQVALSQFLTSQRVDYGQLFLGAAVALVPVLIVFAFLQRWLVEGVERSGID